MLEQPQPKAASPESMAALKGLADKVTGNARMQAAVKAALAKMGNPAPKVAEAARTPATEQTPEQKALARGNPAAKLDRSSAPPQAR